MPYVEDQNARHWRLMALEALAIAKAMKHPECRATMEMIATGYEHLAELAGKEAREAQFPSEPSSPITTSVPALGTPHLAATLTAAEDAWGPATEYRQKQIARPGGEHWPRRRST